MVVAYTKTYGKTYGKTYSKGESKMRKKKHYPPSYYAYREKNKGISITVTKELKQILDTLREKVFLFNLKLDYRKYLKSKSVGNNLSNVFKKKGLIVSNKATVVKINAKEWRIIDVKKEYIIIDFRTKLKIYEKMSYRNFVKHILNENTDYFNKHYEEYIKGFREGSEKSKIWFECAGCNKRIIITPNSMYHRFINGLMKNKGIGHGNCLELIKRDGKHRSQ